MQLVSSQSEHVLQRYCPYKENNQVYHCTTSFPSFYIKINKIREELLFFCNSLYYLWSTKSILIKIHACMTKKKKKWVFIFFYFFFFFFFYKEMKIKPNNTPLHSKHYPPSLSCSPLSFFSHSPSSLILFFLLWQIPFFSFRSMTKIFFSNTQFVTPRTR